MSRADQLKDQGNKAFQNNQFTEAVNFFTQAIKIQPSAVYYTNRAAAYLKMNNYTQALQDTTQSMSIDSTYQKGAQRHVECLIRNNRIDQAVTLAEELFKTESTSKNRELLNEAQRAQKLLGNTAESFQNTVYKAAQNLLVLTAQAAKAILESKFELISSEKRAQEVKTGDDYEMELCILIEALSGFRDNLTNIGMKQLPEDLEFIQKSVPTTRIDPATLAFFFVLMHNFRTTADSFLHFSLTGFICDEEISKNKTHFTDKAAQCITQLPRAVKLSLQASLELQQQKLEQAIPTLQQLLSIDSNYQTFVTSYQKYNALKEKGSNEYKSNSPNAAKTFHEASCAIFNYEEIAKQHPDSINPNYALLMLSAQYLAAITLSNEGMALSKAGQNNLALSRLSTATFLDQTYFKAHQRAGQIYFDAQMYLEAEREYAFASNLTGDQDLATRVKDCQKRLKPHMRKDYYAILDIDKSADATSQDYDRKYKKICAKWHPDRYARDPVMRRFAQYKFRVIQEADSIIRDQKKRQVYDAGGDPINEGAGGMDFSGMGGMGGMGGINIQDILGQMFAGGGGFGGMPGGMRFTVNGEDVDMGDMQPQQQPRQGRQGRQQGRPGQGGMPPGFPPGFFGGFM